MGTRLRLNDYSSMNARSLVANGQEFKGFINGLRNKPEITCIQEIWPKQHSIL